MLHLLVTLPPGSPPSHRQTDRSKGMPHPNKAVACLMWRANISTRGHDKDIIWTHFLRWCFLAISSLLVSKNSLHSSLSCDWESCALSTPSITCSWRFPEGYPKSSSIFIGLSTISHYKPSVWGSRILGKPPITITYLHNESTNVFFRSWMPRDLGVIACSRLSIMTPWAMLTALSKKGR